MFLTSCFVNRPGVLRLIDEAIAAPDIAVIMAGDDVTRKKPDPLIYNLAREKVNLPSSKCVVIEDSLVGLRAAMGADMPCVITPCPSSDVPDFKAHGAKAVMDVNVGLGDGSNEIVTLAKLFPPGAEAPNFDFGGGYGSSSSGSSGGAGSYSSGGYGAAAPVTRVTKGADGVVYDPDQFDADANRRSR